MYEVDKLSVQKRKQRILLSSKSLTGISSMPDVQGGEKKTCSFVRLIYRGKERMGRLIHRGKKEGERRGETWGERSRKKERENRDKGDREAVLSRILAASICM